MLDVAPFSLEPRQAQALQLQPVPPWGNTPMALHIMLPMSLAMPTEPVWLQIEYDKTVLTVPIEPVVTRTLSETMAFLPVQLGGILNLLRYRPITYDATLQTFVLPRLGYASFRLYATTIDAVEGLRRYFTDNQIPVHTEAQRIQDVTDLDTYLTLLFWCVATIGMLGGAAALVASLYASVERKRRALSVLSLLGLPRVALFRYPVYQGIVLSAGGYLVALLCFAAMARIINRFFRAHLGHGESFCMLSVLHVGSACLLTLLIAVLAATWAAWRVTQIEPAEALRDE